MKPRQAPRRRGFQLSHAGPGVGLLVACVAIALATGLVVDPERDTDLDERLPGATTGRGFQTSNTCRACHPAQYDSWRRSYHRTMTQVATPATVLAPFDGAALESRGFEWRFERREDELWVVMPDPVWFDEPAWFMQLLDESWPDEPPTIETRVVMATGSHHMQTYWVRRAGGQAARLAPDDGSLIQVPWMWLIDEGRWVPNQDSFLTPPSGSIGGVARWNANCSQCHSVGTEPGTTAAYERFDTRTAELGIACEACHGPAERHVTYYRSPLHRYLRYLRLARGDDPADPTIVNPAKLELRRSAEVCGQCHSFGEWRDQEAYLRGGIHFVPGEELEPRRAVFSPVVGASTRPEDVVVADDLESRFWRDGTSRVAGREYNALLASTHYAESELTCLSCHSLHEYEAPDSQVIPGAEGDGACVGCHVDFTDTASQHAHHPAGSSGTECMNCHMPRTTYGLFTAMRSHRIDSPDLVTSLASGRPNACNLCHLDRTLEWTGRYLQEWYGQPPVELDDDERSVATGALWALKGDAAVRTIVGWHMGWGPAREASGDAWIPPYLAQLLTDPYSATRRVAYRSLVALPGFGDFQYDYVASAPVRGGLADEAVRRWLGSGSAGGARPELLVMEDGRLDATRLLRLLAERDQTPVTIRE